MPSPFPGMDPYIEACHLWEDFHQKLISEVEGTLALAVPEHYVVRLGERAYVELVSTDDLSALKEHMSQADISITVAPGHTRSTSGGGVALAELPETDSEDAPVTMQALVEVEFRETFVELLALRPERHLVTTIEVMSPSNKRFNSPGWLRYCRKRQAHLEGNANLVEIDLLRGGRRLPMVDEWPHSPYSILVCRKKSAPSCRVWPAHFRKPLPRIHVPLEPPDPDVPLDLQPLIEAIYRRSHYEVDIDYRQPCQPPLDETHAQWLHDRLTAGR